MEETNTTKLPDKKMLELMDKAVHKLATQNPVAHELKKASHRKGGATHDMVLATAFTAMHQLLGMYVQYYQEASIENQNTEEGKNERDESDGNGRGHEADLVQGQ